MHVNPQFAGDRTSGLLIPDDSVCHYPCSAFYSGIVWHFDLAFMKDVGRLPKSFMGRANMLNVVTYQAYTRAWCDTRTGGAVPGYGVYLCGNDVWDMPYTSCAGARTAQTGFDFMRIAQQSALAVCD